jgi:hypothetical protein
MPTAKYEKYCVAVEPKDPNADVMTIQESAYVLKCSVSHLYRVLRANPKLRSRSGRRVVMNKAARDAFYRMNQGDKRLATAA